MTSANPDRSSDQEEFQEISYKKCKNRLLKYTDMIFKMIEIYPQFTSDAGIDLCQ